MPSMDLPQHQTLVRALAKPEAWPTASSPPRVIQTHISSVLLVGDDAYKLKKPLDLGFLDFSTAEKRHQACIEELRLNRRLAPDIYLDVVPVTGSPEAPHLGGEGEPIEWAVHMRRFDPAAVLAECPQRIDAGLIDRLAARVADFHQDAAQAPAGFGSLDAVAGPMADNILQIRARRSAERAQLDRLGDWQDAQLETLAPLIEQRRADGRVRECHGDLHLNNIVLIDDEPVLFDGIEFDPALRYIDVFADLAFLTMDLMRLGRDGLARRLLDRYLTQTGDYAGLPLLRLYEVYRAMVRVKVAAIHASERNLGAGERERIVAELRRYLRVATRLSKPSPRALIITHGVSGSGKTFVTDQLLAELPAVRVRSDVERKRLAGLDPLAGSASAPGEGLYTADMDDRTYSRLAQLAEQIVAAGYVAVIDATFLQAARRQAFAALAERLGVPLVILDCRATRGLLDARVRTRLASGSDASEANAAVLERQLATREPLTEQEQNSALAVTAEQGLDLDALCARITA